MFHASALLSFTLFPFMPQKRFREALLATGLCHSPVDCHSSHDGDNAVFLLAAVHVKPHFKCTSCHTCFLFAKLLLEEFDIVSQSKPREKLSVPCVKNLFSAGNDLETVLLQYFASLCVISFFSLVLYGVHKRFYIKPFCVFSCLLYRYSREFV